MDIGFHQAGFQTLWSNDHDPVAVSTFKGYFDTLGKAPVVTSGDIRRGRPDPSLSPDVVIGGPPCQGYSVAGKMDPTDPRSTHVWEFFKIVSMLKPRAFVMENVGALALNSRWQGVREDLKKKAESLGYSHSLFVLNSSDFGVPQNRERMFFVGTLGDTPLEPPRSKKRKVSLRKALEKLPAYGEPGNDSICSARIRTAKNPVLRKSPFAGMLFNGQGRPMSLDRPAPTLPASMGGNRTPIVDQLTLEEGEQDWVIGYHERLTAGRNPLKRVPRRLRRLTVEEASQIQGFPPKMKFEGSQCAKFRQIGNAVPPALAKAVALSLKGLLES